jgi:hypothetical protein
VKIGLINTPDRRNNNMEVIRKTMSGYKVVQETRESPDCTGVISDNRTAFVASNVLGVLKDEEVDCVEIKLTNGNRLTICPESQASLYED